MGLGLVLCVVAGGVAGVFGHPFGVAPILGALLCAACFFRSRELVVIAIGAVLMRDLIVGISLFTVVRLIGVLAVVGILWAIRVRPSLRSLLLGLALSSPVYHLTLAVGDWLLQVCLQAPRTADGLMTSIMTSVPYFQRSFASDVLFASAFLAFYTLAGFLVTWRWPSLLPQRVE